MTRECIEDMRDVVLPFVKKSLLETNYEGLGKSDAEEFTRDFNEILDLAIKALEQEPMFDKIFCKVHPLSIMSTPELEHKAIMQIAEMLEPLCLPETEET